MLHIRRYLKILGEARKIIDGYGSFPDVDDAGYRGALCIYETAFEQLVISGMPLSEEKDVLRIDTDGDTFVLRKERDAGRLGRAGYPLQGNRPVKEEGIPWEEAPVLNTKENGADSWEGGGKVWRNTPGTTILIVQKQKSPLPKKNTVSVLIRMRDRKRTPRTAREARVGRMRTFLMITASM